MYSIGEKVLYPMHGAGIIEAIEEKEILGEKQKYYILKIPISEMKLMVPVNTASEIGVRPVISDRDVPNVYQSIKECHDHLDPNWNKRYRENLQKIKTGDIIEVAKVVKSLTIREKGRSLSTCEKKMLTNAKQILISELALVTNNGKEQVETTIDDLMVD